MRKQVLLGTTNPAKADYLSRFLADYDVEFLTLRDLDIQSSPEEDGRDPLANARAKAAWYGQFFPLVMAQDSALYIRELPLDDPRQPGLTIKRRPDGTEMGDEEMIAHYSALARQLGGRMTGYYLDGYAVCSRGEVSGFMDDGPVTDLYSFYLGDTPHPNRHPGWPLDSISVRPSTGRYFVEDRESQFTADQEVLAKGYAHELRAFLAEKLGLDRR